jgi:hypothetical protein
MSRIVRVILAHYSQKPTEITNVYCENDGKPTNKTQWSYSRALESRRFIKQLSFKGYLQLGTDQ